MRAISRFVTALGACALLAIPVKNATAAPPHRQLDAGEPLVLYSSQGYDKDTADRFQKQTGITVKLIDDSTGPLIARITAERNNPQWDVVWFDGSVTMTSLDQQGYLAHYMSPNVKNYSTFGRGFVPRNHAFYPTGVTAAGAIVYNKKLIGSTPLPQQWSDLLKPMYKNQVAENDPAFSGPAFPFIAGIMQSLGGVAAGEHFFSSLKANGDKIFQTKHPTLNSVETGARKFGIVQDSAGYGGIAAGQPLGLIYPAPGVTSLPGVAAIDKHAPHRAAAQRFINWLLTKRGGQFAMTHHDLKDGDSYFKPVIAGVVGHRHDPAGIHWTFLNDAFYARRADSIKSWFHQNIVS